MAEPSARLGLNQQLCLTRGNQELSLSAWRVLRPVSGKCVGCQKQLAARINKESPGTRKTRSKLTVVRQRHVLPLHCTEVGPIYLDSDRLPSSHGRPS